MGRPVDSLKNAPAGTCPPGADRRQARRNPAGDCPLAAAFAAIGGRWKLTLLYWLGREPHHFSGLGRRAPPISHKVLTEQLRELEADGLLERLPNGPAPAPVTYRLTPYGRTLLPLIECVRVWGEGHLRRARHAGKMDCSSPLPGA